MFKKHTQHNLGENDMGFLIWTSLKANIRTIFSGKASYSPFNNIQAFYEVAYILLQGCIQKGNV